MEWKDMECYAGRPVDVLDKKVRHGWLAQASDSRGSNLYGETATLSQHGGAAPSGQPPFDLYEYSHAAELDAGGDEYGETAQCGQLLL